MADETKETVESFTGEVAAALVGASQEPPEAEEEVVEETTPEETEEPSEAFSLDIPELPEDLAIELAEAEDERKLDPEPEAEAEDEDWYDDGSEVRKLKAELAKSQKRGKYLEEQRIKTGTPAWRAEAAEYFPLAERSGSLEKIEASSKRDFLRQAKDKHDEMLPGYKAMKNEFEARLAVATEKLEEEVTGRVQKAWGIPTNIPGTAPAPPSSGREKMQRLRASANLAEQIKARLK